MYANTDRRDAPAAAFRARGDHAGLRDPAGRLFPPERRANSPAATPWRIDIRSLWIAHGRVTSASNSFESAGSSASAASRGTRLHRIARITS